ncbi:MAG: succinylglutamate desuccinylase/aspartoacylase family protein [Thermoanaerobaculia bacterium]|nr:succinylglutamate desuccinylase/aspartoacylase family protein [Thermoanaerobaculia bacterium]
MTLSTISPARLEERVLIRQRGQPGPTLLCVAGLHGNEPAGVEALRRIAGRLEELGPRLRGEFVGLVGNRRALAAGRRFLRQDLNRSWTLERLRALEEARTELEAEDLEQLELHGELEEILARDDSEVFLLDMHTTSGPGPAFAVLDDTLENRRFAMELPVPIVLGIEEELDGTLATYLLTRGVIAVGFECGSHEERAAPRRGEAAIWIALEASGLLPRGVAPEVAEARRYLASIDPELPRVVETRYRHPITDGDGFRVLPGFESFQRVEKGETIALSGAGPVAAPEGGRILMPLYQAQGDDGFFIVRDVEPFWLKVSSVARRVGAERFLHWLPGVRRRKGEDLAFVVDRRIARWYTLEILHLFGFRRHGKIGDQIVVSRRQRLSRRAPGRRGGRRGRS